MDAREQTSNPVARRSASRRRVFESIGLVAVWIALGCLFHLSANAYLLMGIPLTVIFQIFIRRKPLKSLWVKGAPRFRFSFSWLALAMVFAAMPFWDLAGAIHKASWIVAGWQACAVAGAGAAAYAIVHARRETGAAGLRCLAIGGGFGGALMLLGGILSAKLVHGFAFHWHWLTFGHSMVSYWAAGFVIEEVSFRGAIDAHLLDPAASLDSVSARRTAALSGLLWGIWHFPILSVSLSAVPGIIVVHVAVGIILAHYFRRSGNLAVPVFTHAFVDAVRNAVR